MKRSVFILFICLLTFLAIGQNEANFRNLKYGISVQFNSSSFTKNAKDSFSQGSGYGLGLQLILPFKRSSFKLIPEYNNVTYFQPSSTSNISSNNFDVYLGYHQKFKPVEAINLSLGIVPSYTFLKTKRVLAGSGSTTIDQNTLENPFDIGYRAGFELELTKPITFEINYTGYLLKEMKSGYIDSKPDHFQLRANFYFGRDWKWKEKVVYTDILDFAGGPVSFVVTDSLFDKFNVDSVIRTNYSYTSFGLMKESEFREKMKGAEFNPGFVVLVGTYAFSTHNPKRLGLFTYNNSMELLRSPFPYFQAINLDLTGNYIRAEYLGLALKRYSRGLLVAEAEAKALEY